MRFVERIATKIKDYLHPYHPRDYPWNVGLIGYTEPHDYLVTIRPSYLDEIGAIEVYDSNIFSNANKKARLSIYLPMYVPEEFYWTRKNKWILSKNECTEIYSFFKSESIFFPELTNWQLLIKEYNDHLLSSDKELPKDFPMPDYSVIV